MPRTLILCDLDHTLITSTFELTTKDVLAKIQTLQERGIQVGLNSDRPFNTLGDYAQRFQLQGPLVCERGNVIHRGEEILFERAELRAIMHKVSLAFIDFINQKRSTINLLIGDSENLYFPMKSSLPIGQTSGRFVLMSKFRQFSIAFNSIQLFHQYSREQSRLEESAWEAHVSLGRQLQRLFVAIAGIDPNLGVYRTNLACILHYPGTEKSRATDHLLATDYTDQIFMIGDHPQDFLGDDPRIVHCAVGNADPIYKAKCQFVAQKNFTCGVLECLEWIDVSGSPN